MILYNVTVNVDEDVHQVWLEWMKAEHLPMVMQTGKFLTCKMFKILSVQEDETGHTYSIQYTANSMADYEDYSQNFAPALQAETKQRFDGKFVAFRTLLELTHQYEDN